MLFDDEIDDKPGVWLFAVYAIAALTETKQDKRQIPRQHIIHK